MAFYTESEALPLEARINFYYAFIFPYLTFNVIVWGGIFKTHLIPLITMHKRIIRTICFEGKYEHSSPLFHKLGLLKFVDVYFYFMGIHMHRAVQAGQYSVTHQVNTRNRNNAVPQFHRLQTCQHAVSYSGPTIWNKIPIYIRNIDSIAMFKKSLKSHLINQYI